MNIDQFLASFPEFGDTDANLVNAKLTEALLEIEPSTWGPLATTGQALTIADTLHGYLTAHKLALSPFGQNARMIPADGVTTYMKHIREIVLQTIPGAYVAGLEAMPLLPPWGC